MTIIIIALIAIIAGILVLISLNMQKRNTANNVNLSADQIVSNVIKKMNYQNLSPVSKENISMDRIQGSKIICHFFDEFWN